MADKKTILVVEDDESVRTLLVRQLSGTYLVQAAGNAQAALQLLATIPVPDLMVCDVMMPGMTGTDLVRKLKAQDAFKQVPIIFLTARGGALDVIDGINAGARHYVTKPFNMKDLLDKVAKAIK